MEGSQRILGWQFARTLGKAGAVIKGVDRERRVTINNIAVPLKVGTAMAAEMMGVCVLAGLLDLVFHRCVKSEHQPMY